MALRRNNVFPSFLVQTLNQFMSETESPWIIEGQTLIYDNPWISITEFDVINPGGGEGIYGRVHFKNVAIGVIAVDDEMNTYLVGQHRFVLNQFSWEIPEGGCLEAKETHLEAAQRELLEETGLVAGRWELLLKSHLSNSVSDEVSVIFLARDLKQGMAAPEETEQDLRTQKLPFTETVRMLETGVITDAISIMAIQKVQLMLLTGAF